MEGQKIEGWQYYNHAMIPTIAPHEEPDLALVKNGEIWKENKALLVRWTSDWDCGYDTGWWYVIREGPFELSELSASSRRNIRKALRNCRVERINPVQYIDDLWRVFNEAVVRYENYEMPYDKDGFAKECSNSNHDYWAGFNNRTGRMIGYAVFFVHDNWVGFRSAKYSAQYLKCRVSDAINATALDYYLNSLKKNYVSDGERSIFHKTNAQEYLIEHFKYRKVFCKLHIEYRASMRLLIRVLYPIRNSLKGLDRFHIFHQLNSLLKIQEVLETVSK